MKRSAPTLLFCSPLFCALLAACGSDSSNNDHADRDLSQAQTFQQLIELREANDPHLDGATVLIKDAVYAYFEQVEVCTEQLVCDTELPEKDEYLSSHNTLNCYLPGVYLRQNPLLEQVEIDLQQHTDFYQLTGEQTRNANFFAQITFVERQNPCASSNQVQPGLKIELSAGEESHLLRQLMQPE